LGNEIKNDEMGGACSMHGKKRNMCMVVLGKPEGKRPVGRPECLLKKSDRMEWHHSNHLAEVGTVGG
jgi:hypothetical protein